jgi:polysaccharide export outer membrane protein
MLIKKNRALLIASLLMVAVFNSCINYKKVPYFQDIPVTGETEETISNFTPLRIHPFDVLTISVTSLNPEASALFNMPVFQHAIPANTTVTVNSTSGNSTAQNNGANNNNNNQSGLLVDENGDVSLPYIGVVHLAGLTTPEAKSLITKKLESFLKEPLVNVRIANFKVGVFGDVNTPGFLIVPNERMTILEAIFSAGDLKLTAVRNNVLLIREIDGKRKFVRFDLNSKSIFSSPYYYLKTNDLVYVQSGNARDKTDNILSKLGPATSLASLILLLFRL